MCLSFFCNIESFILAVHAAEKVLFNLKKSCFVVVVD